MWFDLPAVEGAGDAPPTADHYGIASLAEAEAYLAHPVLGPAAAGVRAPARHHPALRPITLIVSPVDALKLRSSMTLFTAAADAADDNAAHGDFQAVLDRFYDGEPDDADTLAMLSRGLRISQPRAARPRCGSRPPAAARRYRRSPRRAGR